jgi:hypothetical protein
MQDLEPFYNWQYIYVSEDDERSPFYGIEHSQFEYTDTVYNFYIHPQWDYFGSRTLYMKILMADYEEGYAIIEMIGEWNDAIENDIMTIKREVLENLMDEGIYKFILIAENVLNFHAAEKDYYEELYEELSEAHGWAVCLNMPQSSQYDFFRTKLNRFIELMEIENWRVYKPYHLFKKIDEELMHRLGEF